MKQRNIVKDGAIKRSHVLIALAFLLFIAGGLIYGLITNSPDTSNWMRSVGRVIHTSEVRSKWRKVEHFVNGKPYVGYAGVGFEGNCNGDVFEIRVNPDDYTEIYLLNERPLFLKGEAVEETTGRLLESAKISTEGDYKEAFPLFGYTVNGEDYRRVQKIKVPRDSPLVLQEGMRFRVRYWIPNPQRSILDYNERR
jgi:hypothetical protein